MMLMAAGTFINLNGMVWHSVVWFVMVYTMNGSIVGVLLLPGVSALGDEKKPG